MQQVDTTVLGLSPQDANKYKYIASMGIYVFRTSSLLRLLRYQKLEIFLHVLFLLYTRLASGINFFLMLPSDNNNKSSLYLLLVLFTMVLLAFRRSEF